jgi:hypothetical protein
MRKALLPMLVSLALCGAATTAMVMSSAHAAPEPHKPLMVAAANAPGLQLAANDAPPDAPPRDLRQRAPEDFAARMKQMCNDGYARQTAQLAYLETSLQLTAAERPLFERWKDAKLNIAHRLADSCAQRTATRGARPDRQQRNVQGRADRVRPGPADQMAREEDRLKERLADLQTERPALEAFYNALSPAQKMQLTRDGMARGGMEGRGRDGMMMRHHMFADARGPRGPMDGGRMGERPMGSPPPDAPPPEH